jgi:hypothetical protein
MSRAIPVVSRVMERACAEVVLPETGAETLAWQWTSDGALETMRNGVRIVLGIDPEQGHCVTLIRDGAYDVTDYGKGPYGDLHRAAESSVLAAQIRADFGLGPMGGTERQLSERPGGLLARLIPARPWLRLPYLAHTGPLCGGGGRDWPHTSSMNQRRFAVRPVDQRHLPQFRPVPLRAAGPARANSSWASGRTPAPSRRHRGTQRRGGPGRGPRLRRPAARPADRADRPGRRARRGTDAPGRDNRSPSTSSPIPSSRSSR